MPRFPRLYPAAERNRTLLSYQDWIVNAMDCWVAQLGVASPQHREIAAATSHRVEQSR